MQNFDLENRSYQSYIVRDFLSTLFFNKRIPLVIVGGSDTEAVKRKLLDVYGNVEVLLVGKDEKICNVQDISGEYDKIVVNAIPLIEAERFDFSDFVQIMKRLRADDGCEWDRAQTHDSIRINLIEEAYELLEAIDAKDKDMMKEECGDVLMQAIFHTEIAEKEGDFDYADMLTTLCRKLIDRHTHIFGTNHANTPEEALAFWNAAKKKEKKYTSYSDEMDKVPKNLPSLLYAEKLQKRAKKSGFDWQSVDGALEKVVEELEELKSAPIEHRAEEAGDLLFAVVNVLRFYKVDPEMALHDASLKFFKRFQIVERLANERGIDMPNTSLEELDKLWEEAKRTLSDCQQKQ